MCGGGREPSGRNVADQDTLANQLWWIDSDEREEQRLDRVSIQESLMMRMIHSMRHESIEADLEGQDTLRAGNIAGLVTLDRFANGEGERFKSGLRAACQNVNVSTEVRLAFATVGSSAEEMTPDDSPVVVVLAAEDIDVKRDASRLCERLEDVRDHLGREVANLFPLELQVAAEVGSGRDVEDGARKSLWTDVTQQRASQSALELRPIVVSLPDPSAHLIERREASPVPPDPPPLAESEFERLSDRERAVLGRVVVIDLQVAFALDLQAHAAVLGEGVEHLLASEYRSKGSKSGQQQSAPVPPASVKMRAAYVVEESDASVDLDDLLGVGGVVERDGALNVGLARLARDARRSDALRVVACHIFGRSVSGEGEARAYGIQETSLFFGRGEGGGGEENFPLFRCLVSIASLSLLWTEPNAVKLHVYRFSKATVVIEEPVLPPNWKLARGTFEWTERPAEADGGSRQLSARSSLSLQLTEAPVAADAPVASETNAFSSSA